MKVPIIYQKSRAIYNQASQETLHRFKIIRDLFSRDLHFKDIDDPTQFEEHILDFRDKNEWDNFAKKFYTAKFEEEHRLIELIFNHENKHFTYHNRRDDYVKLNLHYLEKNLQRNINLFLRKFRNR